MTPQEQSYINRLLDRIIVLERANYLLQRELRAAKGGVTVDQSETIANLEHRVANLQRQIDGKAKVLATIPQRGRMRGALRGLYPHLYP